MTRAEIAAVSFALGFLLFVIGVVLEWVITPDRGGVNGVCDLVDRARRLVAARVDGLYAHARGSGPL